MRWVEPASRPRRELGEAQRLDALRATPAAATSDVPNWHNRMTAGYTYLRLVARPARPGRRWRNVVAEPRRSACALQVSPERQQLVDYVFPGQTTASFSWKAVDCELHGACPPGSRWASTPATAATTTGGAISQNYQVGVMGLQSPATKLWFQHEAARTQTSPVRPSRSSGAAATGGLPPASRMSLSELPDLAQLNTRPTGRASPISWPVVSGPGSAADGFWNMNLADRGTTARRRRPAPPRSSPSRYMARGIRPRASSTGPPMGRSPPGPGTPALATADRDRRPARASARGSAAVPAPPPGIPRSHRDHEGGGQLRKRNAVRLLRWRPACSP